MAKKGLPKVWYDARFKQMRKLLCQYEINLEMIDEEEHYWQFRATHEGKLLFDIYPRSRKMCVFENGGSTWRQLNESNTMSHLDVLCESFLIFGKLDFTYKRSKKDVKH